MRSNKILIILGALVGIIIIATITAIVLSKAFPREQTEQQPESVITSAEDIIKEIKKEGTIAALSASHQESKTPLTGQETINYTKEYLLSIPTLASVQFEQKNKAASENDAAALNGVSSFLVRKNLTKVTSSSTSQTLYTLFDGKETTCQILNLPKMNERPATLTVSCVKKEAITDMFKEVNDLLALYTEATSKKVNPTTVKPVTFSEGNKKLTTLNVYGPQDKAVSLVFAAIENEWEYLGDRPLSAGTTEANPVGIDRSLSPELKQKIANPKYEGFLQKYIL